MQAPSRNYLKAFNQSRQIHLTQEMSVEVVLKVVNTSYPNVRYPVGKDAESVLKKRAELSDMEMEKWVSERPFLKRKALYVNGLLGKEQSRHDFRLPFLIMRS